jgi:NADP-dependent 3-hydroxy acid dehydrogenase YdfG
VTTYSPVTIVTGGSSGIGAATASRLLEHGHRVMIMGRDPERLARAAKEFGIPRSLCTFAGDVSDHESVATAVHRTIEEFGRLDIVISCAGFAPLSLCDPPHGYGDITEGDPASWSAMVLTNVLGPALLINAALPALKETRGRIVLLSAMAGITPTPGNIYGATKSAVIALAENTRRKVTSDKIGVTLIVSGRVDTPFWEPHGGVPNEYNLTADQVASCITWAISQPEDVDVSTVLVRPKGQAT